MKYILLLILIPASAGLSHAVNKVTFLNNSAKTETVWAVDFVLGERKADFRFETE